MRIVHFVLMVVVLGASIIISAVPVQANTTYMTVAADPSGRFLNPLTFIENGSVVNVYTGVMQSTLGGGATFASLSLNPFASLAFGIQYTDNAVLPSDPSAQALSANIGRAAWLYVTEMPLVNASANKPRDAAALQLAIWDVMVDGGNGLAAGSIQSAAGQNAATQAVYTQAAAWITASVGQSSNVATVLINTGGAGAAQPLITASGALNAGSTPEPSSIVLLSSGLLLVGIAFRKRSAL